MLITTLNTVTRESVQQYLETASSRIDKELDRLLPPADHFPPSIHAAMRYSVLAGGKRLRPILCLEAGRLLGGEEATLLRVGSALLLVFYEARSQKPDDYCTGG
jgi:geranylgeranyl diphosphate synthase type II